MFIGADDLGAEVRLDAPPQRVVSLVPSLTETVALTAPGTLVGATDWCTHPPGLDVTRVRGTKNPDLGAVLALRPELVLAAKEENRRVDVERLRAAGVPVWVTDIRTVAGALSSLRRLVSGPFGRGVPAWLRFAEHQWGGPIGPRRRRAVIPVWRDPWMVVGPDTFTADLAAHLGLEVVAPVSAERYPHTDPDGIRALDPDVIVLPDEPYEFSADDGPEVFPRHRCVLVSGRDLTWYGPSLAGARRRLDGQLSLDRPVTQRRVRR